MSMYTACAVPIRDSASEQLSARSVPCLWAAVGGTKISFDRSPALTPLRPECLSVSFVSD